MKLCDSLSQNRLYLSAGLASVVLCRIEAHKNCIDSGYDFRPRSGLAQL
jgi:hypothetical protein